IHLSRLNNVQSTRTEQATRVEYAIGELLDLMVEGHDDSSVGMAVKKGPDVPATRVRQVNTAAWIVANRLPLSRERRPDCSNEASRVCVARQLQRHIRRPFQHANSGTRFTTTSSKSTQSRPS